MNKLKHTSPGKRKSQLDKNPKIPFKKILASRNINGIIGGTQEKFLNTARNYNHFKEDAKDK